MDLEVASSEQVIEWFEARPEYKELLIEDMRKKLGLHFLKEFKYVFDHTDFLVHPGVGLIPTYILENLVDPTFEVSADPDDFQRCIWQSLWFCLIQKTTFGELSNEVVALEDYVKYKSEFEIELGIYWSDIEDYLYSWRDREFSNGKLFVPISDMIGIGIDELEESETVSTSSSPSGLGGYEHSARVVQDGNGRSFVYLSADGDFLMEVGSDEEAEKILKEIWG
jgi:hypothetical protein